MLTQAHKSIYFYFIIITIGLLFIIFANPFLKYPYDIFAHLITIDELYHDIDIPTAGIPHERLIWHGFWAQFFAICNIQSIDLLLRAKIIFILQTFFNLFSIYFFSHVAIRNLFKHINLQELQYLSLWATLIWFTIFATFSVHYHLIWSLWYSVNYQITLTLFFYITALTLILFLEETSIKKKVFFIIQILLLSKFILQVHAMEFMYYLMYLLVFSLIYINKSYQIVKKYYYILIPLAIGFIYYIKEFQRDSSELFNYMNFEKFPLLYDTIISNGKLVVTHLNRSSNSINELMYLTFIITIITIIHIIWKSNRKTTFINKKVFILIFITSLFILIPLYEFSSGIFSIITRKDVIHRIYYSSSIFILLPVSIYYISKTFHLKFRYVHILLVIALVGTTIYSKHNAHLTHNYYKNIQSIKNSFFEKNIGFHLSQKQIDLIGQQLQVYEEKNHSEKKIYYYARADIAFVIKYIYRRDVYWIGRRKNPNHISHYQNDIAKDTHYKVLFETPKKFPKYIPFL